MKILILDHNPIVQMALQRMLARSGHDVHLAAEAETAEKLAMEEAFDCVILDVGDVDDAGGAVEGCSCRRGVEFARRLRRKPGPSRRARFVAFTTQDPADLPDDERALFSIILDKPLEIERMADRCCLPRQPQAYLL